MSGLAVTYKSDEQEHIEVLHCSAVLLHQHSNNAESCTSSRLLVSVRLSNPLFNERTITARTLPVLCTS
jgi:hypothetical protein